MAERTERNTMNRGEARDESAQEHRSRQSAREVADWETALETARKQDHSAGTADPDRANAGAIVSRALRAEKSSGQSTRAEHRKPNSTASER